MQMDLWALYEMMKRSRRFEEAVTQLWEAGLISGEMHLGTGEEAILAGIVSQLQPGDAMAVDHRGSAAFLMRGVDPVLLLREMLGRQDGLCRGMGGHMHLFSKEHLAASSGIVGAVGPAGVGFALAARTLRPGSIAVAFFGEGAMNQGMLMESIHLAAAWNLPVLFVCKDDGWAITTQSEAGNNGYLGERVRGLGAQYDQVDGLDIEQVYQAARKAIGRLRNGQGPIFLHASCVHFEGHFLGLPLIRLIRKPLGELPGLVGPLLRAFLSPRGGTIRERWAGVRIIISTLLATWHDPRQSKSNDPLEKARASLLPDQARLKELDSRVEAEISTLVAAALSEEGA